MKNLIAAILAALLSVPLLSAGEWTTLFDGGSTEALMNPYDWGEVSVEDGELHLKADRKFFLCSRDSYSDFVFEGEVLLPAGPANSGFMFRAKRAKNSVIGYQAEVDGAARAWSGGLYGEALGAWKFQPRTPNDSPSGQAFRSATAGSFKRDNWNKYRIEASGERLRIAVNGVVTTDYFDDELQSGVVALQHHGERGQIYRFRNVRIKEQDAPWLFGSEMQLVFDHNLNDLQIKDSWKATDLSAWKAEKVAGSGVLNLHKRSDYKPAVRSPESILWLAEDGPDSFVFDAIVKSTEESHAHRDICLFFGRQDDEHFYYAHLAEQADAHAHSIFVVDGADRKSIASKRSDGIEWGGDWHRVRVERDASSGAIRVYFDDLATPVMEASDKRFIGGGVGIGSFDNTALFDDLRLVEVE
jgi:hypothetical protein